MKSLLVVIKLLLSIALLSFFAKFDLKVVFQIINSENGFKALSVGAMMIILKIVIAGIRFPYILKLYSYPIKVSFGIKLSVICHFFSQIIFSFVGGDAIRIWLLNRKDMPLYIATSAVLLDRVVGFLALIALFLLSLPLLLKVLTLPLLRYNAFIIAGACILAVILFFAFGYFPKNLSHSRIVNILLDLCANSRYLKKSIPNAITSFILSLIVFVLNGITFFLIFKIYGIELSCWWCCIFSFPTMLFSMLPISFAGWGVRETVMVMLFSLIGISTENILGVSVTYGLATLIAAIPGAFYFLFEIKLKPKKILQSV